MGLDKPDVFLATLVWNPWTSLQCRDRNGANALGVREQFLLDCGASPVGKAPGDVNLGLSASTPTPE
jgi:hypothetical protein